MKKLLLIFLLLDGLYAKAQHAYIPMPLDTAMWVVIVKDWHEDIPGSLPTYKYLIDWFQGKDTILPNGKKYYLQYTTQMSGSPIPNGSNNYMATGRFRQDSINKKVWIIRSLMYPDWENIVYDFSLHVGDTITDTAYSPFVKLNLYHAWVDNIDSVYWIDGNWHYRWTLLANLGFGTIASTTMIEGMGYVNRFFIDPFLDYDAPHIFTYKVCCYKNRNQWLYTQSNPWNADCDTMITKDVVPVGIENIKDELSKPVLYPNPVGCNQEIHFNTYGGKRDNAYWILAYDINAKEVFKTQCQPGNTIPLNNVFTRGLYLFLVKDNTGALITQQRIFINQ